MIKGETYYARFQPSPVIVLTGYTSNYRLESVNEVAVLSGNLVLLGDSFVLTFATATLDEGMYRLVVFVTHPDGFIQSINDEEIQLT